MPPFPIAVKLNANRHVVGVLRGFDQFMNIVLDSTTDEKAKQDIGMVVRGVIMACVPRTRRHQYTIHSQVVRGNSIISIEPLERVG